MVPVLWFMVSVLQIYTSSNQKLKSTHKSCFLHKMLGLYVFSVVSSVYLYRPHILPSIHPWKMYHCYWTQSHSSLYSFIIHLSSLRLFSNLDPFNLEWYFGHHVWLANWQVKDDLRFLHVLLVSYWFELYCMSHSTALQRVWFAGQ